MDISPSAAIFLTLLAGLSAAAYVYTPPQKKKEGFAIKINRPEQPPPTFVTGAEKAVQPREDSLLPGAPFGEIANSTPLPYKNPVLERATLFQVNGLLEDLRAFLGFEAKQLEDRSDPNIQLPLTKAKGDFQRLQDEYYVLTSNPGVQSQLNQKDITEIRANMRYLQREARILKDSNVIPVGESGTSGLNGFSFLGNSEGFKNQHAPDTTNTPEKPATRADLNELIIKIYVEMQRLSASGTSDPVTQARVTALTNMRNDVQGILDKLDHGEMNPKDVPIHKSDIAKALPLLSNVNDPLPTVIKKAGLSPILANLLPVKAGSKESDYLHQNKEAINAAIEKLAKGLSWKVELEYTSDNKAMMGRVADGSHKKPHNRNKTLHNTGFPSNFELETTANPMDNEFSPVKHGKRGSHTYPISLDEQRAQAEAHSSAPSAPAHFDWKARAKQIRQAIQARGMDPVDFGCLTPEQESSVAPEFSWRGYSKMVCNRLTTTVDPGLPETCGCPPQGWLGWSS